MDNEIETQEETSLAIQDDLTPVDVDAAVEYWNAYKRLTEEILEEEDYQGKGKNGYKKKSAFRKYATAFKISTKIIDKEIERDEDGRIVRAEYTVKASLPSGRSEEGVGACSIWDKAHEKDKKDNYGHVVCEGPCNGRPHFDKPEHDIIATAHTRAKSRAIADLVGTGEVSSEEMGSVARKKTNKAKGGSKSQSKAKQNTTQKSTGKKNSKTTKTQEKEKAIKLKDGNDLIPPEDKTEETKQKPLPTDKPLKDTIEDKSIDDETKAQIALQTIEDNIIEDGKELTKMNRLKYADTLLKKKRITLKIFREIKKIV